MAVEWTSENSQSGTPKFYLKDGETTLATVSGVKNTVALPTFVDSVDVSGTTITVNDGSIIDETSKTLTVTGSSGYKLAVGSTLNSEANGPDSLTWAVSNNGTATTTATFSKVYELNSEGTKITYSDSGKAVTFTLKGLTSDVTAYQLNGKAASGEDLAITAAATFNKDDGVIELNTDVFGSGNITIESSLPGVIYELKATGDEAATVGEKGWYRKENNTKATYDQHIIGDKGHYYSTGTTITKLTKNATDEKPFVINYATLNGLGKENDEWVGTDGSNEGITVEGKTIKISQSLLSEGTDTLIKANTAKEIEGKKGVKKLTLKSNDYEFALYAGTGNPEDDEDDDDIVEVPTPEANAKWNLGYKTKNEEDTGTGTWTLTQKTSDGWSIVKDKKTGKAMTIQYVAEKTETLATISGLTTNLEGFSTAVANVTDNGHVITGTTVKKGNGNDAINVISISDDEITLNPALYNGKAITLKSSKYKFAEACNSPATEITDDAAKWTVNKSGKAVLTGGKTEGYTLATDGKSINYTKAAVTPLATISGLGSNLDDAAIATLQAALNATGVVTAPTYKKDPETQQPTTEVDTPGTITLNKAMLDYLDTEDSTKAKKIKVTVGSKDPYKLLLDTTTDGKEVTTAGVTGGAWELETKKDAPTGKATYKASVTEGFSLSGDGKTVTYTAASTDPVVLTTLSGLEKSKLTDKVVDNDGNLALKGGTNESPSYTNLITVADNKITLLQALKDNELITKKVSIKNSNGGTFALALGTGLGQEDTAGDWDVSKGTAVYASGKKPGYELDTKETTATYKSSASNTMLATVTGLAKTATTADISVGTGEDQGKIIVGKDALGTSNVKLNNGTGQNYTLKLGDGVETGTTAKNYWTIGSGKATYANGVPAHYALNGTSTGVTYTKAGSATNLAAVTGLSKTVKSTDVEFDEDDSHVIVIKKDALPYAPTDNAANLKKTKIALKGDGYKLALDSELTSSKAETTAAWGTPDKGKATLTNKVTKAGFVVTDTSITYGAADSETTLATLSGVTGTISAPVNGVTTITSSNVNGAKIAIKGDGYTLKLDSNGTAPTVTSLARGDAGAWTTKSTTATLNGKTNAGYSQTDPNTITYVKALGSETKDVAIATIKGVESGVDLDGTTTTGEGQDAVTTSYVSRNGNTIAFNTTNVDDALSKNITVDGKGVVKFNFAAYSDASITGGSSNDTFTFAGDGLTINPVKGADHIDLGSTERTKGDTFIYKSGDGYDKIANFSGTDKLNITGAKKIEVTHDETNTYVNVDGKGTITLDAFNYSGITIGKLSSVSLMSSVDLDSSTDELQDIITVDSTNGYTNANFSADFTLSGKSAFSATISFTKKGAAAPAGGD